MRGAMEPKPETPMRTAEQHNAAATGKVEFYPVGPGQTKLEAAAAVALHALVERNEKLTIALSEVLKQLECGNAFEAKLTAEQALHDL